jgi:hypothetical protein
MNQFLNFESTQRLPKQEKTQKTRLPVLLVALFAIGFFVGNIGLRSTTETKSNTKPKFLRNKLRNGLRISHKAKMQILKKLKSSKAHKEEEDESWEAALKALNTAVNNVPANALVNSDEYKNAKDAVTDAWVDVYYHDDVPEQFEQIMDSLDDLKSDKDDKLKAIEKFEKKYDVCKFNSLT